MTTTAEKSFRPKELPGLEASLDHHRDDDQKRERLAENIFTRMASTGLVSQYNAEELAKRARAMAETFYPDEE